MHLSIREQNLSETHITPEFQNAFDIIENSDENVFITGKAGTGKSTFLNYFRSNTRKKFAILAPTGVAALNVGGQTIHSFFRFKPSLLNLNEIKPNKNRIIKSLQLLIIDEISMVRADVFDAIDKCLRISLNIDRPFGGVQLCVIGDLFQLPPIIAPHERDYFNQNYETPFFFSAQSFQSAHFYKQEFSNIYRQNDNQFIEILNAIRSGACDLDELDLLNTRLSPRATPAPGTLVLTATNALAERINALRLDQLDGAPHTFTGNVSGEFGQGAARMPAPEQLTLKIGAQIMFVKNDSDGRWVNGTIGIVEALKPDHIKIRVGQNQYDVKVEKWKSIRYDFDEAQDKIVEKQLGTYTQFPIILAWAITIHKSQGKTLDRAIIDLGTGAFAPGQLYVALSRCRSLESIALKHEVKFTDMKCDQNVIEFMNAFN